MEINFTMTCSFICMSQLQPFIFYLLMESVFDHSIPYISSDNMRRTFTDIEYDQMACLVDSTFAQTVYYAFLLPFAFDTLFRIGNSFPDVIYVTVASLTVIDEIALCFK